MGPLEWTAYLQECSRQIIDAGKNSGPVLPEEAIRSGWLGYDRASGNAIRQAEKRLGIGVEAQFGNDPRVDLREFADEGGMRVKRSLAVSTDGDASWNPGMKWISDSFERLFRDESETFLRLPNQD